MKEISVFFILVTILLGASGTMTAESRKSVSLSNTTAFSIPKVENDIEFSIQTDDGWETSSQQKLLHLTVKNKSQSLIKVKETSLVESDYIVELKNNKGKLVSLSEDGKRKTNRRKELSVVYVKVNPGEEITRKIDLMKLYSLENGATYTVSISKSIYIDATKRYRKIESNTIKIKV